MKKSIARWSATVGLVGSTLIGTLLGGNLQALALSEQEVVEQLQPVPVFTITDNEGAPLVAEEEGEGPTAGAFISQQDAIAFIEQIKRDNPDLGNRIQVVPVSLGEIYQINKDSASEEDAEEVRFAYVPMNEQVEQAVALLKQENPQVQEFQGVPLFVARGAGEQEGFLTIDMEGRSMIPFFFEQEQLQERVQDLNVKIEVVPLEGVIQALQTGEEEFLKNILLVPSRESLQFLQSLSPNNPRNESQPAPQQ
ncbi:MAG: Tic22 family protein [Cyanobacteriota bacterium]|nr:Tic22 family protein [Cyanobacteriota bacterium]